MKAALLAHMSLDDAQKAAVRDWIQKGASLSEIQSRISQEMGASLTYMEVKFLVDDLGVLPKDPEGKEHDAPSPEDLPSSPQGLGKGEPGSASTSVTVDRVNRPGSLASGSVTFSSGNRATWTLDQLGRVGMTPATEGFRPSSQEMMEFERELQKSLDGMRM